MNETKELLTEKQQGKQTANEAFAKIAQVIRENFVSTYETDGCKLIMRLPSGQKFSITVADA